MPENATPWLNLPSMKQTNFRLTALFLLGAACIAPSLLLAENTAKENKPRKSLAPDSAPNASQEETQPLPPLVVIGAVRQSQSPATVLRTDSAIQPVPAQDGADLLKCVPGVAIGRKGGSCGEVSIRGSGGSRIAFLQNGENVLGGCPNRMDPPTAYAFPAFFDSVTVIKGPQTVLYGPGNMGGVVLFEKEEPRFDSAGAMLDGGLIFGSHARNDQFLRAAAGNSQLYAEIDLVRSESDDFKDGNGDAVHSAYQREGARAVLGWTPDADTRLELSSTLSQGEAAYAHSMMDATKLDRANLGVRFEKKNLSSTVRRLEARAYHNRSDHVMDNYSMRAFTPSMMMPNPAAANVDYTLYGGRLLSELAATENLQIHTGASFEIGAHRGRSTSDATVNSYKNFPWETDAKINDYGFFLEATHNLSAKNRLVAGLRLDYWTAKDERAEVSTMMGASPNPTAGQNRDAFLKGGFLRYEHGLEEIPLSARIGIGYAERAPDYWEMFSYGGTGSISGFNLAKEKPLQLDIGANYENGPLTLFASAFLNHTKDYILVQNAYPVGMGMTRDVTRNVDAVLWGGEIGGGFSFAENWKLEASLAYTQGKNSTDHTDLAQIPPLEGKIGLAYATPVWSVGIVARLVSAQTRYTTNQGSIIGTDLGPTGGFAVFSLNAGWNLSEQATLFAGIDNLFDKAYAEHVSRAGGGDPAYAASVRTNEPGRTYWARLQFRF